MYFEYFDINIFDILEILEHLRLNTIISVRK